MLGLELRRWGGVDGVGWGGGKGGIVGVPTIDERHPCNNNEVSVVLLLKIHLLHIPKKIVPHSLLQLSRTVGLRSSP